MIATIINFIITITLEDYATTQLGQKKFFSIHALSKFKINYNSMIVEYQKINLLDNTPNQSTRFRTKNWVEIIYEARGTYNTNTQIRFKTSILRSSLCDYSDVYVLIKGIYQSQLKQETTQIMLTKK